MLINVSTVLQKCFEGLLGASGIALAKAKTISGGLLKGLFKGLTMMIKNVFKKIR